MKQLKRVIAILLLISLQADFIAHFSISSQNAWMQWYGLYRAWAATTYYATPSGGASSGSCGTGSRCTFAFAKTKVTAGDTLILGSGTYVGSFTYNEIVSGTSDIARTIYKSEVPLGAILRPTTGALDGGGSNTGSVIWVYGKSWVTFDGLVLDGAVSGGHGPAFLANDVGGAVWPNGITFQNGEVKNASNLDGTGSLVVYGTNHIIRNNAVHHCTFNPSVSPLQCHGIYVGNSGSASPSNAIVEYNRAYSNVSGWGIHLFHHTIDNAIVRFNEVFDNADGIEITDGANIQVYGNRVYRNTNYGITTGFTQGGSMSNTKIVNNILYNNGRDCVRVHAPTTTLLAQNNLCLLNGGTNGVWNDGSGSPTITAGGNISSTSASDGALLVSPANANFHIASSLMTSLIGAGVSQSSIFTVDGDGTSIASTYDIGAFQFVPAATPEELLAEFSGDNVLTDTSSKSQTASLQNGATYGTGKYNTAFSLDGTNDYVRIAHAASLNVSSFTAMAWIYPTTTATTWTTAWAKGGNFYCYVTSAPSGAVVCGFTDGSGINQNLIYSTPITANTWTHFAIKYDAPLGLLSLILNSTVATTASVGGVPLTNSTNLTLGDSGNAEYFPGLIDEFRFYSCALGVLTVSPTCAPSGAPQTILAAMNTPINSLTPAPSFLRIGSGGMKFGASASAIRLGGTP